MRGQIQRGPNGTERSLRHALVLLRMNLERMVAGGERDFMPAKSQGSSGNLRGVVHRPHHPAAGANGHLVADQDLNGFDDVAPFTARIIQRQVPTGTSSLIKI